MKKNPLFSIITVVLNDCTGLMKTLQSVRAQTFRDFEWVVIDGGSSDGTLTLIESMSISITAWVSGRDGGIYEAMNKGVAMATSEYVLFLNAGDVFSSSDTLKAVADNLSLAGNQDILFGGATLVWLSGIKILRSPRPIDQCIWHGLPAIHQATYYKRTLLLDTPYDTSYRICGDYYLAAKLFRRGVSAAYMDEAVVDFSMGGTSLQNPWLLWTEPYRIQRDILGITWGVRAASFLRRMLAYLVTILLSAKWARVVYCKITRVSTD